MYSQLIKKNDYIIVQDTIIEFINQKFINKGENLVEEIALILRLKNL